MRQNQLGDKGLSPCVLQKYVLGTLLLSRTSALVLIVNEFIRTRSSGPGQTSLHACVSTGSSSHCCCSVTQSCLTLCDAMDCSLPGSSVHEISQARILEWVAISFSRESSRPGVKPSSPALKADSLLLSHQGSP